MNYYKQFTIANDEIREAHRIIIRSHAAKWEAIKRFRKHLTPRDYEILKKRFGDAYSGGRRLEDVAKDYGITRERVRQKENEILLKIMRAYENLPPKTNRRATRSDQRQSL